MKEQTEEQKKVLKKFSRTRVLIPVFIGLGVSAWLLWSNFQTDAFSFMNWSYHTVLFLALALVMMGIRDLGYIYRIRVLTDYKLKWKNAFQIIYLWEFSSAISPSVVGGGGPTVYFLYKEGINTGKGAAVVMTAIMLDELFFLLSIPLIYLFIGHEGIFASSGDLLWALIIGYLLIVGYTFLLVYGLLINPGMAGKVLIGLFSISFLKRWRNRAMRTSFQLSAASLELKSKPFKFWFKAFSGTMLSWIGRFGVVNFMFIAFFSMTTGWYEHLLIIVRQVIMWILLLVSPTPGGSGIAEIIFGSFLGDLIPTLSWVVPLALLWRLITYYPYLFAGSLILPMWIKRTH